MREIADRLDARPAAKDVAEIGPGDVHHPVGLAVARAEQKTQGFGRQVRDFVLDGVGDIDIGRAGVGNRGVRGEAEPAGGGNEAGDPVAKTVAILVNRHRGVGDEMIRDQDVRGARIMDAQMREHGGRLRMRDDDFVAEADAHEWGSGDAERDMRARKAQEADPS